MQIVMGFFRPDLFKQNVAVSSCFDKWSLFFIIVILKFIIFWIVSFLVMVVGLIKELL